MATLEWDDEELLARAVAAGVVSARAERDGRRNGDPFVRVWPPSPGTVAGNALGFLRYLTRDPASALRVESPFGYSLTLDRAATAPNAVIGVAFDKPAPYRSAWTFLHPGETIFVPGGFSRFWMWNADALDAFAVPVRPFGYCSFLVGVRPDGRAPKQRAPLAHARLVNTNDGATPYLNVGAMGRIIITAIPQRLGANVSSTFVYEFTIRSFRRDATTRAELEVETLDSVPSASNDGDEHAYKVLGQSGAGRLAVPVRRHSILLVMNSAFLNTFAGPVADGVFVLIEGE